MAAWLCLATGAAVALAAAGGVKPLELRTTTGSFRPLDRHQPAPPRWYAASPLPVSANGRRYLVAITPGPLTPDQRRQLEAAGAELLDYLPVHGYRLRVHPKAEADVRALPFVTWLGELPAHHKVHPDLASKAADPRGTSAIRVILEAGEPAPRVLDVLSGAAPVARHSGKDGAIRVEAIVPAARLASLVSRLAGMPEVESVEPVRELRLTNQDAVWVHQSFVGPSPQQTPLFDRGIFGCGQTVAVSDSGQDYDLCFFRDPNGPPPISLCAAAPCSPATTNPGRRKDIIYYNWSGGPTGDDDFCPGLFGASGHGTHTSGSAAGDGTPFADCSGFTTPGRNGGDGQAPGAKLVIEEMGDGLEYLNNRGGTVWNLADVAYKSGARIHSNSWGGGCSDSAGGCVNGCTIPYDSFARDADLAMWTYPDLLMVFSAGNAGDACAAPNSVGTPAIAKSPIAAGSLGHGSAAVTPSSFSSPGPVFDGRLKPTLAAQGESVVSAGSDANPASNNCDTCSLDGTSMSAPTMAGLAALVREYYTAGFYAAGTRSPAQGLVPSGALMKATLIDSGVALGAAAPAPDFQSGYGRIQLNNTLTFTGSAFQLRVDDHREGIATGSVVTHAYNVAAGTPLRATLVWTDPPAALNAAAARVNELQLEVIDPNGTVWFQTLSAATGAPVQTMNPADPHDGVNVEEHLVFPNPAPGPWAVRVRGLDIAWGAQPFALVVRGALTDCVAPAAPSAPALTTPADHQVQVSWSAVPGATVYDVYRSLGACAGGPWIQVGANVAGTSYLDSGVSGGASYSYYVTAASGPGGLCESSRSGCSTVTPTGDCFLNPDFGGAVSAASAGLSGCTVNLGWDPASAPCGPDVRYNVYRGAAAGFTPSPASRIARCVAGASYADSASLASGTAYHYIVRAEDATTGHGGSCRDGNEENNVVDAAAAPFGPPVLGTWSDDAGDTGAARMIPGASWTVAPSGGHTSPKVYVGTSADGNCTDLTTPPMTLASPALGPLLTFSTIHDLEYDPSGFFGAEGSIGQVEIATGPGFSNWIRLPLSPDYPAPVEFPLNNCPTTQNFDNYFTGTSTTYTTYTASLANWGGNDIRIRFHISSDLIYPGGTWSIDDIQISQAITPGPCTMLAPGPPPIPDGSSVPGSPLTVTRSGANLLLSWDASICPAPKVNVYWGHLGSYASFAGGVCNLPDTGTATLSLGDNVWFLVAATDGASTDGSWSRSALGQELSYQGASAACPSIAQHAPSGQCQ